MIIILIVILLIVCIFFLFRNRIINTLVENAIKRAMKKKLSLPDGLHAFLIGSGSPMPAIDRAGPCIAVMAGEKIYVVDGGDGSAKNIMLCGLNIGNVRAILLTHFHSDHIAGLGEIMLQRWAGGSNEQPLEVIGPTGVEEVVAGFNMAYKLDTGYRVDHHGVKTMPPSGAGGVAKPFILSSEEDSSQVVVDSDGVKITAFKVDHKPVEPAVGYKFEYKGRSLVISGDTKYSISVEKQSAGVDLLMHEALSPKLVALMHQYSHLARGVSAAKITADIPSYHSTPEDAAKIAQKGNVRKLVLYHIIPPIPSRVLNGIFLGDAKKYYDGPITMGVDGLTVSLPAHSKEIVTNHLL